MRADIENIFVLVKILKLAFNYWENSFLGQKDNNYVLLG